jgi:hypothetical protein
VRAAREGQFFALLGSVGLDDANAAERFGQTPGERGGDLAPFAKERSQARESKSQSRAESPQHQNGD